MINDPLNPADLSYYAFLADDEQARQRAIRRCRAYVGGQQFVFLTDRLKAFLQDPLSGRSVGLDDSHLLRLNVCHTINRAVTERLLVKGFDSGNEALSQWAADVWQRNRMDARADDVHDTTVRDGESFVIVSWDNTTGLPRFSPHPRYVESADGIGLEGDGFGIKAFYQDDDDNGVMLYAVKRWIEVVYADGKRTTRKRMTVYYPDRVEKYEVGLAGNLIKIQDADDPGWPIRWTDSAGMPLGIPVVHFKNPNLSAESWEAIPVQNAINKTLTDLLASSDMTAFRVLVALGFMPVDEDGEPWQIEPGQWVGTTNPDGKVQSIDGADLSNQLELLDSLILKAAQVTDTPASRFITTKAIAGAETQKQQDAPLIGKIRKRQTLLGNAWEDAMYIARRLSNTFGTGGLDEVELLSTQWEKAEVRDEDAELERAAKKQNLGIPQEQIWAELGYDQAQIDRFTQLAQQKADQESQRAVELAAATKMPAQSGSPISRKP